MRSVLIIMLDIVVVIEFDEKYFYQFFRPLKIVTLQ